MREYNSYVQHADLSSLPRNATHCFLFCFLSRILIIIKPRQKGKYFKTSFIYLVLSVKDFYKAFLMSCKMF